MSFATIAIAAIKSAGAQRVYELGSVPASPTYPYIVIDAGFDRATTYTMEARHSIGDYRVTVQSFGRTLTSARDNDDKARQALLDRRLELPGLDCGHGRGQVLGITVRDPDTQGVIGVTSTYLFATTEET